MCKPTPVCSPTGDAAHLASQLAHAHTHCTAAVRTRWQAPHSCAGSHPKVHVLKHKPGLSTTGHARCLLSSTQQPGSLQSNRQETQHGAFPSLQVSWTTTSKRIHRHALALPLCSLLANSASGAAGVSNSLLKRTHTLHAHVSNQANKKLCSNKQASMRQADQTTNSVSYSRMAGCSTPKVPYACLQHCSIKPLWQAKPPNSIPYRVAEAVLHTQASAWAFPCMVATDSHLARPVCCRSTNKGLHTYEPQNPRITSTPIPHYHFQGLQPLISSQWEWLAAVSCSQYGVLAAAANCTQEVGPAVDWPQGPPVPNTTNLKAPAPVVNPAVRLLLVAKCAGRVG